MDEVIDRWMKWSIDGWSDGLMDGPVQVFGNLATAENPRATVLQLRTVVRVLGFKG